MRVALGGIALSLSACDAGNEMPLLPPHTQTAEASTAQLSESPPPSDSTTTQRGAYVGAGF